MKKAKLTLWLSLGGALALVGASVGAISASSLRQMKATADEAKSYHPFTLGNKAGDSDHLANEAYMQYYMDVANCNATHARYSDAALTQAMTIEQVEKDFAYTAADSSTVASGDQISALQAGAGITEAYRNLDQSATQTADGGLPEYVRTTGMDGSQVTGLLFSRSGANAVDQDLTDETVRKNAFKSGWSQWQFATPFTRFTGFSFDYKYLDSGTAVWPGDASAATQGQTSELPGAHALFQYRDADASISARWHNYSMDLTADGDWHTFTCTVAGNGVDRLIPKIFDFRGALIMTNLRFYTTANFDSDGGTAVASESVAYGGKITKPTDPTKESTAARDYSFDGWYDGDNAYDFDTAVTGEKNLTAHWKASQRKYPVYTFSATQAGGLTSNFGTTKLISACDYNIINEGVCHDGEGMMVEGGGTETEDKKYYITLPAINFAGFFAQNGYDTIRTTFGVRDGNQCLTWGQYSDSTYNSIGLNTGAQQSETPEEYFSGYTAYQAAIKADGTVIVHNVGHNEDHILALTDAQKNGTEGIVLGIDEGRYRKFLVQNFYGCYEDNIVSSAGGTVTNGAISSNVVSKTQYGYISNGSLADGDGIIIDGNANPGALTYVYPAINFSSLLQIYDKAKVTFGCHNNSELVTLNGTDLGSGSATSQADFSGWTNYTLTVNKDGTASVHNANTNADYPVTLTAEQLAGTAGLSFTGGPTSIYRSYYFSYVHFVMEY